MEMTWNQWERAALLSCWLALETTTFRARKAVPSGQLGPERHVLTHTIYFLNLNKLLT